MGDAGKPQRHALSGVAEALRRAALRARELACQTQTPLVIWRNGRVERLLVDEPARDERGGSG